MEKAFKVFKNGFQEGFKITFANGCTISVIFGRGSYSDEGKTTAEVAAFDSDGEWLIWDGTQWTVEPQSDVMPRQTPEQVLNLMNELSNYKNDNDRQNSVHSAN